MADKLYGAGPNKENPFFPDEDSFEGTARSVYSSHGSVFINDVTGSNTFEDRLPHSGKIPGKQTKAATGSRSMGQGGR